MCVLEIGIKDVWLKHRVEKWSWMWCGVVQEPCYWYTLTQAFQSVAQFCIATYSVACKAGVCIIACRCLDIVWCL